MPLPFTPLALLPEITDSVLIFALVMAILLLAPLIFERFKVPGMIGLIAAGIVVGPHGLGLLSREGIFDLLGEVGLVYLMFLAGLEINLRQFGRQRNDSMLFGSLTFLIPQVGGTLLARWIFGFSWPASVLLASMFASHTLVPFSIVQRLGLAKNRAATTTVGGTILTDTAALLVLAVIAEMTVSELSVFFFVRMAVLLAVFVTATLTLLPRLGQWFFREVEPDGPAEFAFVLTACFVVSALAHYGARVEPIIGAFLAGLALSAHVPEHSVLMSRLQFVGHALFIPFFLLAVGMLVDLSVLFGGWFGWAVALFMSVTVTAAKWSAARLSGRLLGLSRDEGGLMFGLSVNQAAATLAAVLVGYRLEIFGEEVLNGTILMILVTCMIGPWMTDRYGRRISARRPLDAGPEGPEIPERIMLPMDYARNASLLMDFALMLRSADSHEPLYPLNVSNEDDEARVAAAERVLAPAVLRAVAAGAPVQPATRIDVNTAAGILRAIREMRISTVVMGWGGHSAAHHMVFHRIPDLVIDRSRQAVFICRLTRPLNTVRRIVLLAPPLVEHQPGLPDLLRSIRRLAAQESAPVLLLAGPATARHLRPRFNERPRADCTVRQIDDWSEAVPALRDVVQPDDGILLLSVRRARLAWQPRLERLPRELAAALPDHNFVVAYAAEPESTGLPAPASVGEVPAGPGLVLPSGLAVRHVRVGQRESEVADRLDALLRDRFGDNAIATAVRREVMRIEPAELVPGAVLLHAHIPQVDRSEIDIGVGETGVSIEGIEDPVRVLFVLLSGSAQPATEHLRALAGVAGLARIPGLVEHLAAAPDAEEARRLLTRPPARSG